jgi:alkylhydroperoxidase/carboxymuconolactone decarboxylase family protein YurZ
VGDDSAVAQDQAHTSFAEMFRDASTATSICNAAPGSYEVVQAFWQVPMTAGHLSPRLRELVLLAMHASSTSLNLDGIERSVDRARSAGASDGDIVDVLVTISAVANHSLYAAVPALLEELEAAGMPDGEWAPDEAFAASRDAFLSARGFWNQDREAIAHLMPDYFRVLQDISTQTWTSGALSAAERDLICIAIDCNVTHSFPVGLRRHIRNALQHGVTADQILQVFQLAALLGVEGYILGARAMYAGQREAGNPPGNHSRSSTDGPRQSAARR